MTTELNQFIKGTNVNVQRGETNLGATQTTANITITSVDMTKSFVTWSIKNANNLGTASPDPDSRMVGVKLTTSTNLELSTNGDVTGVIVCWEVIENA